APIQQTRALNTPILTPTHSQPISYERFRLFELSINGRFLIFTKKSSEKVSIVELGTWKDIKEIVHQQTIHTVLQTKDGRYLFTASWDNTIKIVDSTNWNSIKTLSFYSVEGAYLTPDDKHLVVVAKGGQAEIIEIPSWKPIRANASVTIN